MADTHTQGGNLGESRSN